ncbi:accessory Sec system translocase SecA2 [Salinibacillus aidingensis]|uniref:Protein translocase subunit SecA n=1 Tax=Salinibacillus aidingensis TaxID=237684 RepID=A0ABN1AYX1_9BACI
MSVLNKQPFTKDDRNIKGYKKTVEKINSLESHFEQFTDAQLRSKTDEFKKELTNGKTLHDIAPQAFAVVREASKRVLGLRHYDVQLLAGLTLLDGKVAEMATGEGKTLVGSLPSYLVALEQKGVHVITVNEYLASRDKELIGPIHEFLGLNVGLNVPMMGSEEKKEAYNCDITYGVGTEFGFDYLRDNMVRSLDQKVQRPYHYAIVDEIDSVLIDEARTPLIIAGKDKPIQNLYGVCAKVIKTLKQDEDFTVDRELKVVNFTDQGLNKCEKIFSINNLFDLEHSSLFHALLQALRARMLFERDVDYIVEEDEVKLVDMNTGRVMEGRSLSDGLHQAIEAKEGVPNTDENKTQASITIQNYYRMYPTLSGMTGTAKTEETEFKSVYNMEVVQVPPNKPNIRVDLPDMVYLTKEQKYAQLVKEVKKRHDKGQPVLIGTRTIVQSEQIADYLNEANLDFELLNAKSVEQEAKLISMAGQKDQITIATNMAGRGTDIMLGDGVAELGGLHVIGTERNEARRIDNQLKGRSARQGDPGSTQFIISLEDNLFIRYASDELERLRPKLKSDETGLVTNKGIPKFVETAQKISEGVHFSHREFNLKLEDIINDQSKIIYQFRDSLLDAESPLQFLLEQTKNTPNDIIAHFCSEEIVPEEWNLVELEDSLNHILLPTLSFEGQNFETRQDVESFVKPYIQGHIDTLQHFENKQDVQNTIRNIALYVIDTLWKRQLDAMNQLKEGIGIRHYQQEDPFRIFQNEGYDMFEAMYNDLYYELCSQMKKFFQNILEKEQNN